MKRFLTLFSIGCLLITAFAILFPASALSDGKAIRDGVIRLHILANSDSPEDQALKLTVRDQILDSVAELTDGCDNRDEAEQKVKAGLDHLEAIGEEIVQAEGYDYPVTVTLTEEYYPTREYEDFRLPAGRYLSLRIIIGEGQGHNWWCVVFPPVCLSSAKADEELAEVGFTPNQVRMLTDDEDVHYVVRFRVVEVFSDLGERIRSLFKK